MLYAVNDFHPDARQGAGFYLVVGSQRSDLVLGRNSGNTWAIYTRASVDGSSFSAATADIRAIAARLRADYVRRSELPKTLFDPRHGIYITYDMLEAKHYFIDREVPSIYSASAPLFNPSLRRRCYISWVKEAGEPTRLLQHPITYLGIKSKKVLAEFSKWYQSDLIPKATFLNTLGGAGRPPLPHEAPRAIGQAFLRGESALACLSEYAGHDIVLPDPKQFGVGTFINSTEALRYE